MIVCETIMQLDITILQNSIIPFHFRIYDYYLISSNFTTIYVSLVQGCKSVSIEKSEGIQTTFSETCSKDEISSCRSEKVLNQIKSENLHPCLCVYF